MKKILIIMTATLICGFLSGNGIASEGIDIHGFVSQGYVKTTDNNFFDQTEDGTFQFNEMGINFGRDLNDKLHLGLQIFAKDLGKTGNDNIELDWAYGDYHFKDWLGFTAGKLKVPHGLYNQTRDVDMLRTSIMLPQSVYPEVLRETTLGILGAGIYGNFGLNKAGRLSYQFVAGSQNIDASERTKQAFMDTPSSNDVVQTDTIDVSSKYAGSLVWDTPLEGLRLSWTTGNTKFTTESHATSDFMDWLTAGTKIYQDFDKFEYTVYSGEYSWGELILAAEYMETERSYAMGGSTDFSAEDYSGLSAEGWYASASYRFTDWFVLGTFYSKTESEGGMSGGSSTEDLTGREYQDDLCVSTQFDISDGMTFKLEGHDIHGTNGMSPLDNPADADGMIWTEDWRMFAAKITYSF